MKKILLEYVFPVYLIFIVIINLMDKTWIQRGVAIFLVICMTYLYYKYKMYVAKRMLARGADVQALLNRVEALIEQKKNSISTDVPGREYHIGIDKIIIMEGEAKILWVEPELGIRETVITQIENGYLIDFGVPDTAENSILAGKIFSAFINQRKPINLVREEPEEDELEYPAPYNLPYENEEPF